MYLPCNLLHGRDISKLTTGWRQSKSYILSSGLAWRPESQLSQPKETEAVFPNDLVIQVQESACVYTKRSRRVLFTCRERTEFGNVLKTVNVYGLAYFWGAGLPKPV